MRILPPALTLLLLVAMVAARFAAPGPILLPVPWNGAGLAPLVLGLWLLVAGSGIFRRVRTNINTFRDPDVLVTEGVFRISRNPMYLGFTLLLLGAALLLGTATPLAGPILFALVADLWYIRFEERAMRRRFGAAYEAYARKVRRWI